MDNSVAGWLNGLGGTRIGKFGGSAGQAGKTLRTLSFSLFHRASVLACQCWNEGNFVMKRYLDSFDARQMLSVGAKVYAYYSLHAAEKNGLPVSRGCRSP